MSQNNQQLPATRLVKGEERGKGGHVSILLKISYLFQKVIPCIFVSPSLAYRTT